MKVNQVKHCVLPFHFLPYLAIMLQNMARYNGNLANYGGNLAKCDVVESGWGLIL